MPQPIPVATFTNSRCSTPDQCDHCSPRAMMLTSLSTSTGAPSSLPKRSGTANASQPGMIGGFTGRPVECSTGPGRPIPTPTTSPMARPARATSRRSSAATQSRTASGPAAMSRSALCPASIAPARLVTPSRACVAPRSAASTTRASGLNTNRVGGRPPVESASPAGVSSRWPEAPPGARQRSSGPARSRRPAPRGSAPARP